MNDLVQKSAKTAIHLHLYYSMQLGEILEMLHNYDGFNYDLFVSLSEDNPEIRRKIIEFSPNATIYTIENRGYDIGPFIDFLHRIDLDTYDYILKIHTKRDNGKPYCLFNNRRFDMTTLRNMMFDALLHSPKAVADNLRLFTENPRLGMLGSRFLLTDEKLSYDEVTPLIEEQMQKIGLKMPQDRHFIAGTMFLARAPLFKPFLKYNLKDFPLTDGSLHDCTLAHILERMFSLAIWAQGYTVAGVSYNNFWLKCMYVSFKRFCFQKKITRGGKVIIKICKLPVYYGRVQTCKK